MPSKKLLPISFGLGALLLAGCGGGGGGSNPSTHAANLQIQWAARSRAVTGPASALSASITVADASPRREDLTLVVDRAENPAAYTQTYSVGQAIRGPHALTVRFYSGPNASGDVVATATGTLADDGTTNVTTTRAVDRVTVVPGQHLTAGTTETLAFNALDDEGSIVAVSPGSAFWTLVNGNGGVLELSQDGIATANTRGTAQVRVTVDGVTSETIDVQVDADPNGDVTVLSFDDLTAVGSTAGTEVSEAARLSDRYLSAQGISFSSGGSYVSVVQLGSEATSSGENGIGGSTADGKVTYGRANPIVFTFFDPLNPTVKGVTKTFSLTTDKVGKPGNTMRLEAYDVNGNLIALDEEADTGGVVLSVPVDNPAIHRVVFLGSPDDNDGVAVDDVTFGPVVPALTATN
jgi:hypothetical protein